LPSIFGPITFDFFDSVNTAWADLSTYEHRLNTHSALLLGTMDEKVGGARYVTNEYRGLSADGVGVFATGGWDASRKRPGRCMDLKSNDKFRKAEGF